MTFPVRYDRFLASYSIQKSGFTNKTFFRAKNGQKSYLRYCYALIMESKNVFGVILNTHVKLIFKD